MDYRNKKDKKLLKNLEQILTRIKPKKLTRKEFWMSNGPSFSIKSSQVDCDEVFPNIFIGNEASARCKIYLKYMRITHVLNAAEGREFGKVNTGKFYYNDMSLEYLGLNLNDITSEKISAYFDIGANFIEKAVCEGRILVHCMMGISRSATIVCAYLMIKRGLSTEQALTVLRRKRDVYPNIGFLYQLIDLEKRLKSKK